MIDAIVRGAAYHEAAHAVIAVVEGLPLQEAGIHIDTLGEGITCMFQRMPGNHANAPSDVVQRERTIVALRAGFIGLRRVHPGCSPDYGAGDDSLVRQLLREMWNRDEANLASADHRLTREAGNLVDKHWAAIESIAEALLRKPLTGRPKKSPAQCPWASPDYEERVIAGSEIATMLASFGLTAIVLDGSYGDYHPPDLVR